MSIESDLELFKKPEKKIEAKEGLNPSLSSAGLKACTTILAW